MENKDSVSNGNFADVFPTIKLAWVIVVGFLLWKYSCLIKPNKIPKKSLVTFYQVDKKTLNKWIKYFCSDVITDYNTFLKQRKLSPDTYANIVNCLGDVKEYPVLSKKNIIEQADGTYRSLRESVQAYPHLFGISIEAYSSLNKFPPKISETILNQYQ